MTSQSCVGILPSTVCLQVPTNFPVSLQLRLSVPDLLFLDDFLFFYRYFVSFMTAVPLRYCEGSSPPQRGGTRFQRGARLPQTESGFHTSSLRANASLPHIPSMSYPSLFMLVIKWQWRWGKLWNGLSTTNLDCHQIPHSWERMKYVISLEMH